MMRDCINHKIVLVKGNICIELDGISQEEQEILRKVFYGRGYEVMISQHYYREDVERSHLGEYTQEQRQEDLDEDEEDVQLPPQKI
jgi:hypothetical protein